MSTKLGINTKSDIFNKQFITKIAMVFAVILICVVFAIANTNIYSTDNTTNVTGKIERMLTKKGVCHLGSGVFYVDGIDMPDNSTLTGNGTSTKIVLFGSDETEGYAIKLGTNCVVSNLQITGNAGALSEAYLSAAEPINRCGILWQGDASDEAENIPQRGTVTECYISNFSGGGITCADTGYGISSGLNVSDCYIWNCYEGINIEYWSEFSKWCNISVNNCHYGAIDNGGNQIFSNCNFSGNTVGMVIDNSKNQSRNNSHGSVSNCIFDHSGNNIGVGIKLIGVNNGEQFSNCQLFYSSIEIDRCKGISMTNFNYGKDDEKPWGTITVINDSFVVLDKFICRSAPVIAVDDTSKVIMTNSYTWTGEPITFENPKECEDSEITKK